ncbi:MAG TPA: hypothetical protein VGA56_19285 [Opitutaceae bacterium]
MNIRIQDLPQAFSLFAVALAATGYSHAYRFEVDAVRNPLSLGAPPAYRITSAHPSFGEGDRHFDKVADSVRVALSSKGMFDAPEGTPHESDIEIDFGMGAPELERRTTREPVLAVVAPTEEVAPDLGSGMAGDLQQMSPLPQVVGFRDVDYFVTVYRKFIRITARAVADPDARKPPAEQWSVYVENVDESDDLDRYLPLMVAAGMDSIASEQAGPQTVVLNDRDPRVDFIERGLAASDPEDRNRQAAPGEGNAVLVAGKDVIR